MPRAGNAKHLQQRRRNQRHFASPTQSKGERAGHVPKAGGVSAKQRIRWIPDTLRMDTEARSSSTKGVIKLMVPLILEPRRAVRV